MVAESVTAPTEGMPFLELSDTDAPEMLALATRTKPGPPPRGETSTAPLGPTLARATKGDSAMKRRQCTSSAAISFFTARSFGAGYRARSASRVRTSAISPVYLPIPVSSGAKLIP